MENKTQEFAEALLKTALKHHEDKWENGDHEFGNCDLCEMLIQLSVDLDTSLADLKLLLMETASES